MAKVSVNITGLPELLKEMKDKVEDVNEAAARAVREEAIGLFEDSQVLVPVDKGRLRESGEVRLGGPTVLEAEVAYTASYAWPVHENPRSGKTGGVSPSGRLYKTYAAHGQWKYLEQPMKEREETYKERFAAQVRRVL